MNRAAMAALIGAGVLSVPTQTPLQGDFLYGTERVGRTFQPTKSFEPLAEARKRKKAERNRKRDQRRKNRR